MSEIKLRRLEEKDIPGMLEWMHDPDVNRWFRFDAAAMTQERAQKFISDSFTEINRHYAITDSSDEYLGTISLKNIRDGRAEYAISTRKCAHGSGAAIQATSEVLRIAFEELGLDSVYLNVLAENLRANAFYRKAGFCYTHTEQDALEIRGVKKDLNWYEIRKK